MKLVIIIINNCAFDSVQIIPKLPPNGRQVKLAIDELAEIFAEHHKSETISYWVLEVLTELLVVLKEFPLTINDWAKFVNQAILRGCKQKFSPRLTIQLLEFYQRFYEVG